MAKSLDRFRLQDALETHGDIVLYRAEEELPGGASRSVLVRVFPAPSPKDKTIETRFHTQVKIMADLSGNPNVVPLFSAGVTDNQPWIAMELLTGNFAGLRGEKPGAPAMLEKMLRHMGQALAALHAGNPPMLHNAVVPENIRIDALGNFRLGGFDSSGPASSEIAYSAAAIQYAAPEMLTGDQGRAGPQADLYALGHVAYEFALGSRLYRQQFPAVFDPKDSKHEASSAKWMAWHYSMGAKVPPVAELIKEFPPAHSDIIARLTAKSLGDRMASAAMLLADLDRAGVAVRTPPPLPTAPVPSAAPAVPVAPVRPPTPARTFGQSAVPADPNAVKYYVRLRGRMTGPFDLPTLQRHARQGAVSRLHEVSTDRQTWRNATTIEGLFGGATAGTPPEG